MFTCMFLQSELDVLQQVIIKAVVSSGMKWPSAPEDPAGGEAHAGPEGREASWCGCPQVGREDLKA